MHFLPFTHAGQPGLAAVKGAEALDLASLSAGLPTTLDAMIAGGEAARMAAAKAVAAAKTGWRPVASFTPTYPVNGPHKVICLGLNYALHAKEGGHAIPDYPAIFLRTRDSMLAAGEAMVRPKASAKFDYEAELMVVIGTKARHVSEKDALAHVFGYTMFNDGSVRDYQRKGAQWTPGKNFDRTGPVGPVIATADAVAPGANGLRILSRLNGEIMQDSDTSDMIFSVARAIAIVSEVMTLNPGDMLAMGTPSGVGYARSTPVFLKPGDTIEVEIEGIGVLSNGIVDEVGA